MLPSYRNHPVSRMDCTKAMSPRMFWALPSSTNMRASSAMGMLMRGVTFCVANHDAIWSPLSRDCPMTGVTPCVAGRKLLVISETGEVHPCEILDSSMGNLREVDFDVRQLLKRKESRELVDWIKTSKCKCSFECALAANVVWNASQYPKMAASAARNVGRT